MMDDLQMNTSTKKAKIENESKLKNNYNCIWTIDVLDDSVRRVLKKVGIFMKGDRIYSNDRNAKINKKLLEQMEWSAAIHAWLRKLTSRYEGRLMNEGLIAKMLNDEKISFSVDDKVSREKTKEVFERSNGKMLFTKRDENDKSQIVITIEEAYDMALFMREMQQADGRKFIAYEIDVPMVKRYTPTYINQLRSKIMIQRINITDIYYSNEQKIRMMFCKPFFLYSDLTLSMIKKIKSEEQVVYIMDSSVSKRELKAANVLLYVPEATKLIFEKRSRSLSVYTNMSPGAFENMRGNMYGEMIEAISSQSMIPYHQEPFDMHDAKLVKVLAASYSTPRGTVRSVIDKLIREVESSRSVVTMVMIANKGSGKSTASSILKEKLDGMCGRECYVIDSDAAGRWLYDVEVNNTKVKTFNELLSYNNSTYISLYELMSERVIQKYDLTYERFRNMMGRSKSNIVNELRYQVDTRLIQGMSERTEKEFYTLVQEMVPKNSILIIETHRITQDAVVGGTDITLIYESMIDPIWSFKRRDNPLRELLLYEVYNFQKSHAHTSVNLNELAILLAKK